MTPVLHKPAEKYEAAGRLAPQAFDQCVTFRTYPPSERLAPFVAHFWTIRWNRSGKPPYFSEQVMHKPYIDLFVSAHESGIQGTFRGKRVYVAEGNGRIVGVRFHPGGFHAFWNGKLTEIIDRNHPVQRFFPEVNDRLVAGVLSLADRDAVDALAAVLESRNPQPDFHIELLNKMIDATIANRELNTVKAVALRFHRSERWIQQLFLGYVGVGLKWLLQRNRLIDAARTIRESAVPDWAGIAYNLGYSSQGHFINDFKRVVGQTPLQYKKATEK